MFFYNKEDNNSNDDDLFVYNNIVFPQRYHIVQKTLLSINDVTFNEIDSEIIWRFDNWQSSQDNYIVSLLVEKHEVVKCPVQMKELTKFLELFNHPVSNLLLLLNSEGIPIKVINQNAVYEKWLKLRNNELAGYDKDETTKNIIRGGDEDFSDILPVLLNSMAFILFFPSIYGNSSKQKKRTINQNSYLFQGNDIEINIKGDIVGISNINRQIRHVGTGFLNDYDKAEKLFKNSYKQITDTKFNYEYELYADYEYQNDGLLNKCYAEIKEQASNCIVSKQTYSITLLK